MTYERIVVNLSANTQTLTDAELEQCLSFLYDLEAKVCAMGTEWSLARWQCSRKIIPLEGEAQHRGWQMNNGKYSPSKVA